MIIDWELRASAYFKFGCTNDKSYIIPITYGEFTYNTIMQPHSMECQDASTFVWGH